MCSLWHRQSITSLFCQFTMITVHVEVQLHGLAFSWPAVIFANCHFETSKRAERERKCASSARVFSQTRSGYYCIGAIIGQPSNIIQYQGREALIKSRARSNDFSIVFHGRGHGMLVIGIISHTINVWPGYIRLVGWEVSSAGGAIDAVG